MKLHISIIAALLAFVSIAGAKTPTLQERAAEITAGRDGASTTTYIAGIRDLASVGKAILVASDTRDLTTEEKTVLVWYAGSLPVGDAQAVAFRSAGAYDNALFIIRYITEAEVLGELIAKDNVDYRRTFTIRRAAERLGEPALIDVYYTALTGKGIFVPDTGAKQQRDATYYVQWFDNKALSLPKAEALSLLNAEIRSLMDPANKQEDSPAWSARLSSLQGTHAVLSRL